MRSFGRDRSGTGDCEGIGGAAGLGIIVGVGRGFGPDSGGCACGSAFDVGALEVAGVACTGAGAGGDAGVISGDAGVEFEAICGRLGFTQCW